METAINYLLKEAAVIRESPVAFALAVFFAGLLIFFVTRWIYIERLEWRDDEIKKLSAKLEESRRDVKAIAETASQPALADSAELRLHVYGDARFPTEISRVNVWRYFWLRNGAVFVLPDGRRGEGVMANLIISFDKPVAVKTLSVSSPDITLPRYEVKEFNTRFAVIFFERELAPGTLVVSAH